MPRSPDSTTDTYLDVLRTLGVPDAALRRHHDATPETPLRVAIDGDRGAPTADLLSALGTTGRVLDLRDGLAAGDGDCLTAALGRFGYTVECTAVADTDSSVVTDADSSAGTDADSSAGTDADSSAGTDADSSATDADSPAADAGESDALELRVRDVVTGDDESLLTAPDAAAVEATLREELLAPLDVELAELLDGRHLVAEARELRALAASYGDRVEPFDDPLLVPGAAIDVDDGGPSASAATAAPVDSPLHGGTPGPDARTANAPSTEQSESEASTADGTPFADDGNTFGDVIADADDATTDSIEAALSEGGPSTHTIESDDDLTAASETTVGGGPRRTVSTTGIDEVFDQLESSTAEADSAQDGHDSTDSTPAARTTTSDSSDAPIDASAPGEDTVGTGESLSGGPKRTVSTTSADDILARATGERDFEAIAAEEGDADPDAVLAEGEVPPALEDSGVTPALSSGAADAAADDESVPSPTSGDDSATDDVDASVGAEESVGAADRPPADPAADASVDESVAPTTGGPDADTTEGVTAAAGAGGSADASASSGDRADPAAPDDADPATPMPPAGDADRDEREPTDDATATPDPVDLGDELLGEDVELRDGSVFVDEPTAPGDDPAETSDDVAESTAADGPLAARGGVRPGDGSSEPDPPDEPVADDPAADDQRPADAPAGRRAGDDSTAGAPETDDPAIGRESAAADDEPDADAVMGDEPADDGGDAGLVGRITSTIFGR